MKQELEIEFKNIVTKEEFTALTNAFTILAKDFKTQENYYFDTPQFELKEKGSALRIRYKNGNYTLTLKQPANIGLLESHQGLSEADALAIISGKMHFTGEIANIIQELGIDINNLTFFGSLKTMRSETSYKGGLLVFDQSFYLDKEDFELEYEVKNADTGKENFHHLLTKYNIPIRLTENKIERFYLAKLRSQTEEPKNEN